MEIGRARLQPVRQIHVRSPRSQSPPCLSSSGTRTTRSQARTVPGGSGTYCSGESTISPSLFSESCCESHAAHNDIRSQYAYANNMLVQLLYESSSTSSTSTSSEEDRRSIEPSLRGEEPWGGLPIPESGRWI